MIWYSMSMSAGACFFAAVIRVGSFALSFAEWNVTSAGLKIAAGCSRDLIDAWANFVDGCKEYFEFWDF